MRLSVFKRKVINHLIKDFNWPGIKAQDWVTEHPDYMKAMWESAAPEWEIAEFISEMK